MSEPEKKRGIRTVLIKPFFLFLNAVFIFLLLFSYAASKVSPDRFWPVAFAGLAYPYLLVVNIIFIVWWIIFRKRYFLLSLLTIAAGYHQLTSTFAFHFSGSKNSAAAVSGHALKLMTYNVRLFDLYNWTHNLETREKIFSMLKKEAPDILCLQEFYQSDGTQFDNVAKLQNELQAKNIHVDYSHTERIRDHWGIATCSVYPIIGRKTIHIGSKGGNLCLATDVVRGSDTIRIFNVHLESIRFMPEDYKFVENFGNDTESQELEGSKRIFMKLKIASQRRARQAEVLKKEIDNSPYKVIVCGDFNDTPSSYTYNTVRSGLQDAFLKSGSGMSGTYAGNLPSFRIDYILHDKKFSSSGYEVIHEDLSDHYPVKCFIDTGK
jgi:endonuclease/exonuclease/phosphatase family metal-dependent hydrolase